MLMINRVIQSKLSIVKSSAIEIFLEEEILASIDFEEVAFCSSDRPATATLIPSTNVNSVSI